MAATEDDSARSTQERVVEVLPEDDVVEAGVRREVNRLRLVADRMVVSTSGISSGPTGSGTGARG